jgi:anti-sigma factor RsiW
MTHPDQATLALHAGGDLGPIARWRTNRHIAHCERCREEVASFAGITEILPELAEMPEVPWSGLSAEMKANIRLGLEAGECVRPGEVPLRSSLFSGARAAVALASVAALLVTGLMLEHPAARPNFARFESRLFESGIVLESTKDGIEVGQGRQALQLRHAGASGVTYTVGAQGSIGARYLDPKTGYVTINKVYVEE